jgi:hypothetical protein
VVGNGHSHIFEWLGCPYYDAISPDNRVPFPSPQAAEAAGDTDRRTTVREPDIKSCPGLLP